MNDGIDRDRIINRIKEDAKESREGFVESVTSKVEETIKDALSECEIGTVSPTVEYNKSKIDCISDDIIQIEKKINDDLVPGINSSLEKQQEGVIAIKKLEERSIERIDSIQRLLSEAEVDQLKNLIELNKDRIESLDKNEKSLSEEIIKIRDDNRVLDMIGAIDKNNTEMNNIIKNVIDDTHTIAQMNKKVNILYVLNTFSIVGILILIIMNFI